MMYRMPKAETYDVVICGGGPVGLLLGIQLSQKGISNLIVEQRTEINPHSRSIGIHPPSLRILENAGLARHFLEAGRKIRRGHAMIHRNQKLGQLSFDLIPGAYPYLLTMPQNRTEQILEEALRSEPNAEMIKGVRVTDFEDSGDEVEIRIGHQGKLRSVTARFLIGCDGKQSTIRQQSGISTEREDYPFSYTMGDYADDTGFGDDAVIFITPEGLVESFPLPEGTRRWVVEAESRYAENGEQDLTELISRRTGYPPDPATNTMVSNFGTEWLLSPQFHRNRVVLAGDAAHVVSPIGGQGMNLGWLDTAMLATTLDRILNQGEPAGPLLKTYTRHRKKRATEAIKRAEFNMMLGHKSRFPGMRNLLLKAMLKTPVKRILARRFTMWGLD